MAIVDVVVIPVGTEGPSVSKYIAEIQTKLNEFKQQGKIDYQLTPMNLYQKVIHESLESPQKGLSNHLRLMYSLVSIDNQFSLVV